MDVEKYRLVDPFQIPSNPDELEQLIGWFFARLRVIVSVENHHMKFHNVEQLIEILEEAAYVEDVNITIGYYDGQWDLLTAKDEEGNPVNGPMVYPPYYKAYGALYVESYNTSELNASYQRIHTQKSYSPASTTPRVWTFDSSEDNPYNLYWECVDNIREHLQPHVTITCKVIDIRKEGFEEGQLYNVGDIIYIRLPGRTDLVECRITKTTKDPRKPEDETLEISNYKTTFLKEFFKNGYFKSPGAIQIYGPPAPS